MVGSKVPTGSMDRAGGEEGGWKGVYMYVFENTYIFTTMLGTTPSLTLSLPVAFFRWNRWNLAVISMT